MTLAFRERCKVIVQEMEISEVVYERGMRKESSGCSRMESTLVWRTFHNFQSSFWNYFLITLVKTKSLSIHWVIVIVFRELGISFSQLLPLDRCLLQMNWVKISVFSLVSTCIALETGQEFSWPPNSSHWMLPTNNQRGILPYKESSVYWGFVIAIVIMSSFH